jgi:hypothetical protein
MPQKLLLIFCNLLIVTLFIAGSCNKQPLLPPYLPQYENIGGYVIGGETCNADTSKNYWLLNFTVYQNSPQIGDTITLHGST